MKPLAAALATVMLAIAVFLFADTFLTKCRADIALSKNAGRIADALEIIAKRNK